MNRPLLLELSECTANLGDDELRTLIRQARRLSVGQSNYGKLRIMTDTRNFLLELQAELDDAQMYLDWHLQRMPMNDVRPFDEERESARLLQIADDNLNEE